MISHGSLFTGIGGFDLGFERAGFETAWQAEIDPFCSRVLAARWPGKENLGDVTAIRRPPAVDVLTFGSPCQDLSVAGRRGGFASPRSGLFFEAARLIGERLPALAVWENVPGAFSSNAGRDFLAAVRTMAELGALDVAWRVFDSQYAGVPQRRRRVFLVADFGGRRAAEVLFEREGCGGHPPAGGATWQGPAATLRGRSHGPHSNEPGRGGEDDENLTVAKGLGSNATGGFRYDLDHDDYVIEGPSFTLQARRRGYSLDPTRENLVFAHADTPLVIRTAQTSANGHGLAADAYALGGRMGQAFAWQTRVARNGRGAPSGTAPSLLSSEAGGRADFRLMVGGDGYAIRRFTPVECERLQGFPDGWTCLCGSGGEMFACRCADGPRYCALGNACTVTVVEWIARRVRAVLEGRTP